MKGWAVTNGTPVSTCSQIKSMAPWSEAAERFFELSLDLLCIVDSAGRFVHLSRSWQDFLGIPLSELVGRPFMDFVHADDVAVTAQQFQTISKGVAASGFINRYRSRGGHYRRLSWRSSPPDGDGLVHAVARDVTDELAAIDALAQERARLRAIMDSIADLVFIKDNDFRYLGCNRPFAEFVGHAEDELIGRSDFEFFPPAVAQFFRDNDIAMLRNMVPRRNDEWLDFPDGSRRLYDTQKMPLITDDGKLAGLVGVSRDITEQTRLRSQVEFLGALVNRSRDPLYCLDPANGFSFIYVNDALCQFLEVGRDDIMQSAVTRFCPDLDAQALEEMWRLCGEGKPMVVETGMVKTCGTMVPVEISVNQVRHQGQDYAIGWLRDLTSRHVAERQLRQREALYRASVEAAVDGFWQVDRDGRILDVNTAYSRMSGYELAELRGMHISQLEADDKVGDVEARIQRLLCHGAETFETRHRRKDGSLWDVEVSVLYSEMDGGRFFVYLRDLRRRRRAELLLRARLKLAEISRDNDIDALMTEVLDTAERLTASTIGFFHFVDPDQNSLRLQAWSTNTLRNLCQAEGKGQHYAIDQAGIWAECLRVGRPVMCNRYETAAEKRGLPQGHAPISRLAAVPVPGEGGFGAIIGVGNKAEDYDDDDVAILVELSTMAMDIVNRVRADISRRNLADELGRAAQQWNAAMESFQGGIALLDGECRLMRANAAFFALTGTDPGRVGSVMTGVFSSSEDGVDPIFAGGDAETVLEAGDPGNLAGRPLEVRVVTIHDSQGRVDGRVVSLYDLTHLRQQESRLEATVAELTRSNAELERFSQVTAHDLQEPTRRQVLFAQLLKRKLGGGLDADSRQYLDFMIVDALKMRDMVRALNVYHRAGQSLHPVEAVEMDRVAADVIGTLSDEINLSKARLCMAPLGEVAGERARLHLLLVNLLTNALKFRHPGRQPRIQISAGEAGSGLAEFCVADNGIGIPEQYRDGMFTLFRRMDAYQDSAGMGLAQCRRIVEDMGGRIWIEGNDMGGTTVKFTLPRP